MRPDPGRENRFHPHGARILVNARSVGCDT
jgi:hypothetical protein